MMEPGLPRRIGAAILAYVTFFKAEAISLQDGITYRKLTQQRQGEADSRVLFSPA